MRLKGAINSYPPFTEQCLFDNPPCTSPGLTAEFVQILSLLAGYKDLDLFEPNVTGDVYHAIVDMVARNEYDFGANLYSNSIERHNQVILSIPVSRSIGLYYFKTRSTEMIELEMIILKPFMQQVWFAVISVWFLMAVTIFVSQVLTHKPFLGKYLPEYIVESIQVSYSIMVHESDVVRSNAPYSKSTQVSVVLCSIGFLFLHNFYNAGLLDHLLKREPPPRFKTTQQLAELLLSGDARIVTDYGPNSVWSKIVQGSESGPMADIKRALHMYPPWKVDGRPEVVEAVLADQHLVGVGGSYGTRYSLRDVCDLTLVEDTATEPSWMSLIFPRTQQGNILREKFDSIIPALWSFYGLLEDKYYHKTLFCQKEEDLKKKDPTSLKLSDLQDVFWLWIILMSANCIVFVCEIVGNKM